MAHVLRIKKVDGLVGGIVFGPVDSRRFGRSLGINPLPPDRKLCTFDCPYCECGSTSHEPSLRLEDQPFPAAGEVIDAARGALERLRADGVAVDSLTLTGNGETTIHPAFREIVDGVIALRTVHLPAAKVVVLTNGTRLDRAAVCRALERVDACVVKIDAGRERTFRRINRPLEPVTLEAITEGAARLPRVIVQTLFVRGRVDNTAPDEIDAWIERIARIAPREVQVYSLDRRTARPNLIAVERNELEAIAQALRLQAGVSVTVY